MIATSLTPAQKAEVIREAYRKHAAVLLAIDDAQMKLTIVLLAILGTGASFIAGAKQPLSWKSKLGLTVIIGATVLMGTIYTKFRSGARRSVRELLLRCEQSLGFQEVGVYIPGEKLYRDDLKLYPGQGNWLGYINWLVVAAGIGFLIVLWAT